jgi:hypothetical protein
VIARFLRWVALTLSFVVALGTGLWAVGAIYYDFPWESVRGVAALVLAVALLGGMIWLRGARRKLAWVFSLFAVVLGWWLTLKPSNEGDWRPDVAQLAWAEVNGDAVTLHNVRNCEYRTERDYTPRWETRMVRLSQITGLDLAINSWGSPYMAHPIASFQFADAPPLCFSIETRKKVGQSYSAIGGLYRQFALIYVAADERDVIRLRTNYRRGEEVFLYRTMATAAEARERFQEYLRAINSMREHPRWYNAVTTNCTTSIRDQHPSAKRIPWDWRLLVNGKADELMYERGTLATAGLPFGEFKRQSLINPTAKVADAAPDFSQQIRKQAPGFK